MVPPTLHTSEHMFISLAKQTVPDLPANKNKLPKFPFAPSSWMSLKTQWVMAHSFWYTASKLIPLHTPIVPVRSLVIILLPVGLNLIIIIGSLCGFPSYFGAFVSSFQIVIRPVVNVMITIVPSDGEDWTWWVPFDTGGSNWPWEFILMFLTTFIEQMNFVWCCYGNCWIDWYVWDCNTNDTLVVSLKVLDLSFWEKTHLNF